MALVLQIYTNFFGQLILDYRPKTKPYLAKTGLREQQQTQVNVL
jgi:hypothetical protein